jgi:hypothetical protein
VLVLQYIRGSNSYKDWELLRLIVTVVLSLALLSGVPEPLVNVRELHTNCYYGTAAILPPGGFRSYLLSLTGL